MKNSIVPLPPGGLLEIVFSFDTTGSMASWLDEVRGRIQDLIQRLQADIPGIRIAVFAHGDYCDSDIYVTKWIDLSTDIAKLCDFVQKVESTGGGDAPECYELVLKQVRTKLSWTPGSRRVLVLIGDNNPHEPHEACNKDKINWKEETRLLGSEGVTIYGVQCGNYAQADRFYKTISMATKGKHLRLKDFGSLFDMMMAICYRESNDMTKLANYENEVRARCGPKGLALDIDAIFASLRDEGSVDSDSTRDPLTLLAVRTDCTTRTLTVSPGTTKRKAPKTVTSAKKCVKLPKMPLVKKTKANLKLVNKVKKSPKLGLDKYKLKNLPLLKRENVPENNFSLRTLKWTNWFLACVPESDIPKDNKAQWKSRVSRPGWRLRTLQKPRSWGNRLALFEVSVQTGGAKGKKHTVYSKFSRHCFGTTRWATRLFSVVTSQVDRLFQNGCKVYVRYSLVSQKQKVALANSIKRYDYAWKSIKAIRPSARIVTKGGVNISAV